MDNTRHRLGETSLLLPRSNTKLKIYSLVDQIDAILPQTQCGKCSFPACKPYASAIAEGRADINQCPPGGEEVIRQLAQLLGVEVKPLNAENGVVKPKAVAFIDEQRCIGCTLCLPACPVDAIAGATKLMHTIIASECTGCERCVAPCPVDCISMLPILQVLQEHSAQAEFHTHQQDKKSADVARARYEFHLLRIERDQQAREEKLARHDTDAAGRTSND